MKKQTKKQMMIRNKRIANLPRYEFGKIDNPVGYQVGDNYVNTGFVENPTADLNSEIKGQRQLNWINGASQSAQIMSLNLAPIIKDWLHPTYSTVTQTPSTSINISSVTNPTSGLKGIDKPIETMPIQTTEKVAGKTALGAVSKAASIIGGLVNTAQMGKGIYDSYTSAPTADDVSSWSGTNTNYGIGNVAYKTKTAPNADQVVKLARKRAGGAVVNSTLSGMGAGASFGSLLGPIGTGVGAGVGALVGLIPSIFGWRRSKNKTEDLMNNTVAQYDAYNRMSESVANSQGMINNFKNLHTDTIGYAAFGKSENGDFVEHKNRKNTPSYGKVQTSDGVRYGKVNSMVGFGEIQGDNYDGGHASRVKEGTKGVDNQYSDAQPGDGQFILSNTLINPATGNTFAEDGAAAAEYVEKLNNIKPTKYTNQETARKQQEEVNKAKQIPMQQLNMLVDDQKLEQMRNIADRLKAVINRKKISNYNYGKLPGYVLGKPESKQDSIDYWKNAYYDDFTPYMNYYFENANGNAKYPWLNPADISNPELTTPPEDLSKYKEDYYRNFQKDVVPTATKVTPEKTPKTKTPRPKIRVTGNDNLTPYMMSTIPGLIGMANGFVNANRIKNQAIYKYNPFVNNDAINALHKPEIDYSWKPAVRDAYRQALYNNRTLAGGQKLLANAALNTGMMRTNADYTMKSWKDYTDQLLSYDRLVSDLMEKAGTRMQSGNQYADETYRRAASNKETLAQASNASAMQSISDMFKNYHTNYWTDKGLGQYQQTLNKNQQEILELLNRKQLKNNMA